MGNETSKSRKRRTVNGDFDRYFSGIGIDIGCGNDPVLPDCNRFDKAQGDAQYLNNVRDESCDWVYSSHCLEHLRDPVEALKNWWRVLKPMGYLIVVVPDFVLYEKRNVDVDMFNSDHKHWFSKAKIFSLVYLHLKGSQLVRLQLNDEGFDYSNFHSDQTLKGAQSEIEIIVRKQAHAFWHDSYDIARGLYNE